MTLLVEGFERFADGVVPYIPYLNRTADPLGWMMSSGSTPTNGFCRVDAANGKTRGKGVLVSYAAASTVPPCLALKNTEFVGKTKVVMGFSLNVISGLSGAPGPMFGSPFGLTSATSNVYPGTYVATRWVDTGVDEFVIYYLAGGGWQLLPGGPFKRNTWHTFEFVFDIQAKLMDIVVNGNPHLTGWATGASLDNLNNPAGCAARFETWPNYPGSVYAIDDFYYRDNIGEADPIEPFGPCKVDTFVPNGTAVGEFAPNTAVAANYESVAELPDNPATFNSAKVNGKRDEHTYTGVFAAFQADDEIKAVQVSTLMKSDGPVSVDPAAGVTGSVSGIGATTLNSQALVGFQQTMLVNPATGNPFIPADLDGLRTGYSVGPWPSN